MSLPPGSTIGIIGGGQLGRMMAVAAAQLGYRCHIYDPHEEPCAAEVSGAFTRGAFDDQGSLVAFAAQCDSITYEFENVPVAPLAAFAAQCDIVTYEFENVPVAPLTALGAKLLPGTRSLEVAQDRALEKEFLESAGAEVAPWRRVNSIEDAEQAVAELCLLYTSDAADD